MILASVDNKSVGGKIRRCVLACALAYVAEIGVEPLLKFLTFPEAKSDFWSTFGSDSLLPPDIRSGCR